MDNSSQPPQGEPHFGPPWWRGDRPNRWSHQGNWGPPWLDERSTHKRRILFRRFVRLVLMFIILFTIAVAVLAFTFTKLFGGTEQTAIEVWGTACGLASIFPVLFIFLAVRSFRSFADPVSKVMAAADAVADGDFSVRVPETGQGEFRRLANTFNHMVAELEHTDQQRRTLTADVAHELRTPIHILQGNLEGILDGVYQPTPEQIERMLEETRRLARLVEDLRTLSLAESGQLALEANPVDVAELLNDTATTFSGQAEDAGVQLVINHPDPTPVITGDAGRLEQVLGNLVANALRHTPPGGTITLQADSEDGRVIIQVSDTGEGIPPEDLPFIFDRFWRGDRARMRSEGSGGSGLGLAIVKQLVQAHGGEVHAESRVGDGTKITIILKSS